MSHLSVIALRVGVEILRSMGMNGIFIPSSWFSYMENNCAIVQFSVFMLHKEMWGVLSV